jgi:hypothetical protein
LNLGLNLELIELIIQNKMSRFRFEINYFQSDLNFDLDSGLDYIYIRGKFAKKEFPAGV